MRPRSIAVALAFCFSFLFASYAQSDAREQRLKEVAHQLHLTRRQEIQLIPIMRAEEPKLEAIKNDPGLTKMQKLQRLRAVHTESEPQVKAILTPEQYQQLQEIRQKRRAELMQNAMKKANQ
jgi:Spy/CpxP family protein refolding chaperone